MNQSTTSFFLGVNQATTLNPLNEDFKQIVNNYGRQSRRERSTHRTNMMPL